MAGTVTKIYDEDFAKRIKKLILNWVSDGSGNATGATKIISGQLLRVTFKPGTGGLTPSNNYDATLKDDDEVDVLVGLGANLSDTAITSKVPVVTDGTTGNMAPIAINGALDLAVANAGNGNGGEFVLYYR
jgi:hypothetical protein